MKPSREKVSLITHNHVSWFYAEIDTQYQLNISVSLGVFESCRAWIAGWLNARVNWTDSVMFSCTWEYLGAPGSTDNKPRSTCNTPGSTSNPSRAVWEKQHLSLGMLLLHLELIATTYRLMIFNTHVFSLSSGVCIYVCMSMYLCIYIAAHLHMVYLDWLKVVLKRNLRCAWRWWSSGLSDAVGGRGQAGLVIHFEGMVERTWRSWFSMYGHALGRPWSWEHGGRNQVSLEAIMVWT